ncbi:methionyl-tRNA formyltransferase [Mycoplasma phocoenae]|uniref:methionyl-tRNA formyltransferase n=1 Tax=Mycoplasma phocoenae TaxID=754517 RepID=A0A858U686_9MOLU|nr:methionyl-tRNA formyltransferase [Mycoplasma phocoenae]QJG66743.1 methionyl-tRNA formyltransferase [Mycoplasma phocoenae]
MKLLLAGTIHFSADIFEYLIQHYEVIGIISQPDRALDRKKQLIKTDTHALALKYGIKIYQPEKIKEIYDELSKLDFDFFITAAFGQYIPESILKLAKIASINVHGSLLEKYRGAAPIQHCLLNRDSHTGVSLIHMTKEMDAGDIIGSASFKIEEHDTALELYKKMANLTKENIDNWLKELYENKNAARKQDESLVTFANKINKEDCEINTNLTCKEALSKIKAFNDQPGAYMILNGKRIKLFRASISKVATPLKIKFADGYLYIYEYQFEGKKRVVNEI